VTISKRLDDFYRRDFSCIADIIKDLFPMSHERRLQRDVPIVESVAKETAVWYRRPPTRHWSLPSGDVFNDGKADALRRIYAGLRFDLLMKRLNEMLVVQRTIVGLICPRPGSTDGLIVKIFAPHEVEVDPDPVANESVQHSREFRFRIPIKASHDSIEFGTMRINHEQAVYDYGGKPIGVYREDGSLPPEFGGELPIFVARLGVPHHGDFFSPLPSDLYDAQVALSVAFSDTDMAARFGAWGQKVITNADRASLEKIVMGSDSVIGLDEDQKYEVISGESNLSSYLDSTEQFLKYVTIHNNLNPSSFLKGSLTGLSKMIDLYDRDAIRQDQLIALRDAENGFYNALRIVLNAGVRAEGWPRGIVGVDYVEQSMPADALHEAQSRRLSFEDGLTTPAQHLAKEEGITELEARERVGSNLEEYRRGKEIADPPDTEGSVSNG